MALKTCLIDTGPFVAYLRAKDEMHSPVVEFIDAFTGQLVTTGAVIAEVMYFISESEDGPLSFAKFLHASGTRIIEMSQIPQIFATAELMNKYSDTPMDFADATLVLLADQINITDVVTLDRRGFSTYRTASGKRFNLLLGRL